MERLAGVRAEYGNLLAETQSREQQLETAQKDLAAARATQAAAHTASLITKLDAPDTGTQPLGPSRAMLVAAGLFGGLATGVGVVFLSLPPAPTRAAPTQADETATAHTTTPRKRRKRRKAPRELAGVE
jgi:hypothetical protein